MQIFVDLDSRRLRKSVSNSASVSQLDFKRGDTEEVEIIYVRANTQTQLAVGVVISFGAKIKNEYDGVALVFEDGFTLSGSGETASYIANPSFNTEPLDDALMVDEDESNDLKLLDLMGEITWNEGGVITSSVTFGLRVNNDVLRGDEATPDSLPDPNDWMPAALTYAGVDPNTPDQITVSGITTPLGANGDYDYDGVVNGYPSYALGVYDLRANGSGEYELLSGATQYFSADQSDVANPTQVTSWTAIDGLGPIVVGAAAIVAPVGTHVGQLCKAATAWWAWTGTAWTPLATFAGQPIAYNATLTSYRKLTVSGADGSEIITISAL